MRPAMRGLLVDAGLAKSARNQRLTHGHDNLFTLPLIRTPDAHELRPLAFDHSTAPLCSVVFRGECLKIFEAILSESAAARSLGT